MTQCKKCGDTDISHFYIRKSRNQPFNKCKKCCLEGDRANYKNNLSRRKKKIESLQIRKKQDPLFERRSFLKFRYGLSIDDYDKLLLAQNKCCAICGLSEEKLGSILFVDHDHVSGKIRGLLCDSCNKGLGMFKDNAEILKKAIEYLI